MKLSSEIFHLQLNKFPLRGHKNDRKGFQYQKKKRFSARIFRAPFRRQEENNKNKYKNKDTNETIVINIYTVIDNCIEMKHLNLIYLLHSFIISGSIDKKKFVYLYDELMLYSACPVGRIFCAGCAHCLFFGSIFTFVDFCGSLHYMKATFNTSNEWNTNNSTVCPNNTYLDSKYQSVLGHDVKLFWYPWLHRTFPRCWQSLQHMICWRASKDNVIIKPCRPTCYVTQQFCAMLHQFSNHNQTLSDNFLHCEELPESCKGRMLPENHRARCGYPLVDSSFTSNWVISWDERNSEYKSIRYGCAAPCHSELRLNKSKDIDAVIAVFSFIGLLTSLFTVLSFLIDWKCQKRYPAVILFVLNACFIFFILGWLFQFFDHSQLIGCTSNGDRRMHEPRSKSGALCTISFILIYSSSIAICCWFCVLTYAWYISFKALGTKKDVIINQVIFFHIFSWSSAILLTVLVMLFGMVDADELANICFVNYKNKASRNAFLYAPYLTCLVAGEFFLIRGIKELIKVRADCQLFMVPKAAANITRTLYRLGLYGISIFVAVLIPFVSLFHEDYTQEDWAKSYAKYIRCRIMTSSNDVSSCIASSNIKHTYLYLRVCGSFVACITTSSWTWTHATLKIWYKVWKRFRKTDARQKLQLSWHARMNRKKISPFIPPINPKDPLQNPFTKQPSNPLIIDKGPAPTTTNSLSHLLENLNNRLCGGEKRRHSDDIRSVANLFSVRRGSRLSVSSFESLDTSVLPHKGLNMHRSKSLNNILGHLASSHTPRRSSSNLAIMKIGDDFGKRHSTSNISADDLKYLRDNLYTPLSMVHKDNIVADCVPNYLLSPSKTSAMEC